MLIIFIETKQTKKIIKEDKPLICREQLVY